MISFKHEVFLEVARQLSFTKASQTLYISQPAVTRHIQQLEEQYATNLFKRKGSAIILSEEGKLLYDSLMKVKVIEQRLEYEMSTYHDMLQAKGELKLGASTTIALYIIPPVLSGFRQKFPNVRMSLFNRNSESVLKALRDREIDLGIVEGKSKMSGLSTQPFMTDEVIPVCSSKSPLAKKIRLDINEIKTVPIALRERGSGTLAALKQALSTHGIKLSDLRTSMQLGGTEALKNFILADESIGFLPKCTVGKELVSGDLVRLFIDGLTIVRQFYFVQRHGDGSSELNNGFIKFAKSHYNIKL